jgi:hypothetical protein
MKYILINKQGRVREFYILSTAELYRDLEGGTLITDQLYVEAYTELLVDTAA